MDKNARAELEEFYEIGIKALSEANLLQPRNWTELETEHSSQSCPPVMPALAKHQRNPDRNL
ncbi:MAG: hypothetical protein K2Z81_00820 [Cyanobacteria bacterium]|nr:hypothetical protein [Cyanobacteriota bacterium]